ncbi:MAG: nitroreductase family protein [Bacteroidales bacterium]|jgi:predicted oxidoreductase (fatty acid repression mutant protein)|nr:nitroreductase family protein [Bacteroidales bacterium]
MQNLKEAIANRRSYYAIGNQSPVSDKEIEEIIRFAVLNLPSAFNSQTARLVLLLGEHHLKLWDIVKETLRKKVPAEAFPRTEQKINSFAAGHGTVLYFEDTNIVKGLQEKFPTYADNFPVWSEHTSAIHQFAVWTMLEDAGFGASLQHYNPIIDEEVRQTWNLPDTWKLIAQMPFGNILKEADEKTFLPLDERVKVFGAS